MDEFATVVAKVSELKAEHSKLTIELPKIQHLVDSAKQELTELNKEVALKQEELERITASQVKQRQVFIDWKKSQDDELNQRISVHQSVEDAHKQTVDKWTTETNAIRTTLGERDTAITTSENILTRGYEDLEHGKKELATLTETINKRAYDLDALQTGLQIKTAEIASKQVEITTLHDNARKKDAELTESLRQVSDKKRRLDNLLMDAKAKTNDIADQESVFITQSQDLRKRKEALRLRTIQLNDREATINSR